jgi:hypothetical protein
VAKVNAVEITDSNRRATQLRRQAFIMAKYTHGG